MLCTTWSSQLLMCALTCCSPDLLLMRAPTCCRAASAA